MKALARCPNPKCGRSVDAVDKVPGDRSECPHCGARLQIKYPNSAAETLADPSGRSPVDDAMTADFLPAERNPADRSPRSAIGRFNLLDELGGGVFGTVYRAVDPVLDRPVAIKLLRQGFADDRSRRERFLREGKAAARLRHPHIVPVFDSGSDGDQLFIAAALIEGEPLSAAVADDGLDLRRAARIAQQLADALGYAHREGIVHRDVKPANILLDRDDRPHLADFGMAALSDGGERLTLAGAVVGTPAYMSPEQALGQQTRAEPASDQYALGTILYELLTGSLPFRGPVTAVLFNIISTPPTPLRQLRPSIPVELQAICLKALAKKSEERYSDCRALADDLRRWLDHEPVRAFESSATAKARAWVRRNLATTMLAAGVAFVFAVGTWFGIGYMIVANAQAEQARQSKEAAHEATVQAEADAALARQLRAEAEKRRDEAKANRAAAGVDRTQAEEDKKRAAAIDADTETQKKAIGQFQKLAKDAEVETEALLAKTDEKRKAAQELEPKARRLRYPKLIAAAAEEARAKNYAAALEILKECVEDQRDWEWRFLRGWASEGKPLDQLGDVVDGAAKGGGEAPIAALADDGSRLVVAQGKQCAIFDAVSRKSVRRVSLDFTVKERGAQFVAIRANPEFVVVGNAHEENFAFDASTNKPTKVGEYVTTAAYVHQAEFSGDGRILAIRRYDDFPWPTIYVPYDPIVFGGRSLRSSHTSFYEATTWKTATSTESMKFVQLPDRTKVAHHEEYSYSPEKLRYARYGSPEMSIFDTKTNKVVVNVPNPRSCWGVRFHPSSKRLMGFWIDERKNVKGLCVWSLETSELLLTLPLDELPASKEPADAGAVRQILVSNDWNVIAVLRKQNPAEPDRATILNLAP